MAASLDAFPYAADVFLGSVCAGVHEANDESVCAGLAHSAKRSTAGESCLDYKALATSQIFTRSKNHFPRGRNGCETRVVGTHPLGDGVWVQQILTSFVGQRADNTRLTGAIGPATCGRPVVP